MANSDFDEGVWAWERGRARTSMLGGGVAIAGGLAGLGIVFALFAADPWLAQDFQTGLSALGAASLGGLAVGGGMIRAGLQRMSRLKAEREAAGR